MSVLHARRQNAPYTKCGREIDHFGTVTPSRVTTEPDLVTCKLCIRTAAKCSCGQPWRKWMTHMQGACWTNRSAPKASAE